jgi:hypothetical protein
MLGRLTALARHDDLKRLIAWNGNDPAGRATHVPAFVLILLVTLHGRFLGSRSEDGEGLALGFLRLVHGQSLPDALSPLVPAIRRRHFTMPVRQAHRGLSSQL